MYLYIIGAIIIVLIIYVLVQYNTFIRLTNSVKEAFSTMDIYLKKRWDLIPNLVQVVKGYTKHENQTLTEIVKLRNINYNNISFSDKIETNQKLYDNLNKIMAIAENYPQLKADNTFLDLSSQLTKIEDEIAKSRKYYNAVVRELNIKIEMFPSNIIAKMFNFKLIKMFEINSNERENTKIDL